MDSKQICIWLVLGLMLSITRANAGDFVPVQGMTIGENFIVFEAEATTSPLGFWEIVRPGDARYLDNTNYPPVNNTHLEFTGNDPSIGAPASPLEYTFKCPKTASYRLGARLYQRLDGQPSDKCNDVYIKMAGNFTSGNSNLTVSTLKSNYKFFGRGVDSWGALYNIEVGSGDNKYQGPVIYNLIEGEIYTFTVSGRAQRTNIDYWLLFEKSLPITLQGYKDLRAENDQKYIPVVDVCKTFDAVDMTFIGIPGFTDAQTDNKAGMDMLQVAERDAWAAAQMLFQGTDGQASFTLNTNQETDGESTYRLRVNGELIGEVTNDRIYGTTIADYTVQSHLVSSAKTTLNNGDTIQMEFNNTTNGLVPEGELTATSRGRWLSLDICTSGSFASYHFTLPNASELLQFGDSLTLSVDKLLPYNIDQTLVWSSLNSGIATVDTEGKIKTVNAGTTTITVKTKNGEYEASCEIIVYNSLPYTGTPITIPGVIEAEDYDLGGQGMAYHDFLPYNAGNVYRQAENVDIEPCNDGGYNIRSTQAGEWLAYTIEVSETGIYSFYVNVATAMDARELRVDMDDSPFISSVKFSNTGSLTDYKSIITDGINLTQGRHVIKLYFVTGDVNLSWMGFFLPETVFKVLSVAVSPDNFRLDADETKQMEVVVAPVVAPDKSVIWTSSDDNIATVDSTGLVTGRNQGKAYIKATSKDGAIADSAQVSVFGYSGLNVTQPTIRIYPNPSESGVFHLPTLCTWEVYNFFGQFVSQGRSSQVNLSNCDKGFYILKTGQGVQTLLLK